MVTVQGGGSLKTTDFFNRVSTLQCRRVNVVVLKELIFNIFYLVLKQLIFYRGGCGGLELRTDFERTDFYSFYFWRGWWS